MWDLSPSVLIIYSIAYVVSDDSTKLNNSDLDAKVDAVHSECEPLSSAANGKSADIAVEKSPAEN